MAWFMWLLLALTCRLTSSEDTPGSECQIAILSLSSEEGDKIYCDADKWLHSVNGIIFQNSSDTVGGEGHQYNQYSGPYWLRRAIEKSTYYTRDLSEATAVYVDDYCLIMSIVGEGHTVARYGKTADVQSIANPASTLQMAYQLLIESERYRRFTGSDYVFYSPHPNAGFSGNQDLACNKFGSALHLVAEDTQRYTCSAAKARNNFLVLPYASPRFVEDKDILPTRTISVWFHGNCAADQNEAVAYGMRMRIHVVNIIRKQILDQNNIAVSCAFHRPVISHKELRIELRNSIFCFLIPGDTASSRRLTEVMLSGCIPVFLGPPWHTLPLSTKLSYPQFSIFYDIKSFEVLGPQSSILLDVEEDAAATDVFDHRWWITPHSVRARAIRVESPADVVQDLLRMPDQQIQALQVKGADIRSYFRFRHYREEEAHAGPPTAADVSIDHICNRAVKGLHQIAEHF